MGDRDLQAAVAHAPCRRADRAVARAPAEHEQLGAVVRVDRERRQLALDVRDPLGAQARHRRVVGGVVGDVAGAVLLLQPADAVRDARRAGRRPRPHAARVARVGQERFASIRLPPAPARTPGRSPAATPRRGSATAPTSSTGSRRSAGSPACGTRSRGAPPRTPSRSSRPASRPRAPAAATRRGGRAAPAAGPTARSSSACPVEGPARCTSITTSGSSSIAARPIVSAFRSIPGPLVAVTPRWPPNDGAERHARRRRSRPPPGSCARPRLRGARARAAARRRA